MAELKPTIYPTLVVGLGGTGTNVVRYVKRRFQRTWGAGEYDDLSPLLQVLAVDTEPLVNQPGEEPLYPHEFAFLGGYDATRLIQNRVNHGSPLDWWQWSEDDIALGYIHAGAKQLRPLGRLSFFRKYAGFKTLMVNKLSDMQNQVAISEAENRGFAVEDSFRLVYIVSSLCGGTGAGLFLDVAHRIRDRVGSEAKIIGVFLMPSVFENEVRSDLQRRRIQANAYAALKELNYFHNTQSFQAVYPGEQEALPKTRYRAFSQIFLIERTNTAGRTLSGKAAAEQMAAHLISLSTFSHLNARILGLDVNITEERSHGGANYFSYSTFSASALVMPRATLWRYFKQIVTYWAMELLLTGERDDAPGATVAISHRLRDTIKSEFMHYGHRPDELGGLRDDLADGSGRWLAFARRIAQAARETLDLYGLAGVQELLEGLTLEANDDRLTRDDLFSPAQRPFAPVRAARHPRLWERPPFISPLDLERRVESALNFQLYEERLATWETLLERIRRLAREWLQRVEEAQGAAQEAGAAADGAAREAEERLNPLSPDGDRRTNTFYDLETGAIGSDHLKGFLEAAQQVLYQPVPWEPREDVDPPTYWARLLDTLRAGIVSVYPPEVRAPGAGGLAQLIERALDEDADLMTLEGELARVFDLRSVVQIQHESQRQPSDHRLNQLFRRAAPFARVDGDTYPYSEAVQEPVQLVGTPLRLNEETDPVFKREMRSFSQYEWVGTGDPDRIDVCHVVHGLPVGQIDSMPEMHRQYYGADFNRSTLHVQKGWEDFPDVYMPPRPAERMMAADRRAANGGSGGENAPHPPAAPGAR